MNIFIAGATGAVRLPLVRALRTQGHQVTGMTRPGPGVDRLPATGRKVESALVGIIQFQGGKAAREHLYTASGRPKYTAEVDGDMPSLWVLRASWE